MNNINLSQAIKLVIELFAAVTFSPERELDDRPQFNAHQILRLIRVQIKYISVKLSPNEESQWLREFEFFVVSSHNDSNFIIPAIIKWFYIIQENEFLGLLDYTEINRVNSITHSLINIFIKTFSQKYN